MTTDQKISKARDFVNKTLSDERTRKVFERLAKK